MKQFLFGQPTFKKVDRIVFIGAYTMVGKSHFLNSLDTTKYLPVELDKCVSARFPSKWNETKIKSLLMTAGDRIPVFAHRFVGKSVRYLKTLCNNLDCYFITISNEQYKENVAKRLSRSNRELTTDYMTKVLDKKTKKDIKFTNGYYNKKWSVNFRPIEDFK